MLAQGSFSNNQVGAGIQEIANSHLRNIRNFGGA